MLTQICALALKLEGLVGSLADFDECSHVELLAGDFFHPCDEALLLVYLILDAALVATERSIEAEARNALVLKDLVHVRICDTGRIARNGGIDEQVGFRSELVEEGHTKLNILVHAG